MKGEIFWKLYLYKQGQKTIIPEQERQSVNPEGIWPCAQRMTERHPVLGNCAKTILYPISSSAKLNFFVSNIQGL